MLVVSSELEERSDMRESREIEVVIWVLEKCSMKVVSGGMAELHFKHTLTEERSGQELKEALSNPCPKSATVSGCVPDLEPVHFFCQPD